MGKKDTGGYRPGEKVLVPHTDKFYEAKILKYKKGEDGVFYYLLHYQGWNKKWDEWVEGPGITKFDRKLVEGDKKPPRGSGARGGGGGRRGPRKSSIGELAGGGAMGGMLLPPAEGDLQVSIELPAPLRQLLVDDYEAVSVRKQLPALPAKPCVADILRLYVDAYSSSGSGGGKSSATEPGGVGAGGEDDTASGLRQYFDKALPKWLLYSEERTQAEELLAGGMTPASVYGGQHLLRLLAKLPELLPVQYITENQYKQLEARLAQVIDFLAANKDHFLGSVTSAA